MAENLPERPPGDPGAIEAAAQEFTRLGEAITGHAEQVGSIAGTVRADWRDSAGAAFEMAAQKLQSELTTLAEKATAVTPILTTYASTLAQMQQKWDRAKKSYEAARAAYERAQSAYQAATAAGDDAAAQQARSEMARQSVAMVVARNDMTKAREEAESANEDAASQVDGQVGQLLGTIGVLFGLVRAAVGPQLKRFPIVSGILEIPSTFFNGVGYYNENLEDDGMNPDQAFSDAADHAVSQGLYMMWRGLLTQNPAESVNHGMEMNADWEGYNDRGYYRDGGAWLPVSVPPGSDYDVPPYESRNYADDSRSFP